MFAMLFYMFLACAEKSTDTADTTTNNTSNGTYTDQGSYFVTYTTNPETIPLNEYFSVEVSVFRDDSQTEKITDVEVSVDAIMPAHGHGMAEMPTVTALDSGIFWAEGLKWQMTGTWELQVYITNGTTEMATWDVECCL